MPTDAARAQLVGALFRGDVGPSEVAGDLPVGEFHEDEDGEEVVAAAAILMRP